MSVKLSFSCRVGLLLDGWHTDLAKYLSDTYAVGESDVRFRVAPAELVLIFDGDVTPSDVDAMVPDIKERVPASIVGAETIYE